MAQNNHIKHNTLVKPLILTLIIVTAAVSGWEYTLRHRNWPVSYDEGPELWADKRAKVYEPANRATVFLGASRIKYDLDIPTWKKITGKDAIQLAIEGNSPLLVLDDLSNDPLFKGHVVIDATEFTFFNTNDQQNAKAVQNIHYFQSQTYAQKISFRLNCLLESQLVFLNRDKTSLGVTLDNLQIPSRPGVYSLPVFPVEFVWNITFDRQDKMGANFVSDTAQRNVVRRFWRFYLNMLKGAPAPKTNPLPGIFKRVRIAVEKIRSRGGDVVFIRPPSSGYFWESEQQLFKRELFWNPLIASSHTKGIYFADYPAMNHFDCPEWSHLSPAQATGFTGELIKLLPPSFSR